MNVSEETYKRFRTALDLQLEIEESKVYDRDLLVVLLVSNDSATVDIGELLTILFQSKIDPGST